jgi:BirA family transcriptional regulator, biotin operon repressor / biotin---[acetyl-CoA-carboxylase] ligase
VRDTLEPAEVLPRLRGRFGRPYRYAERCASTQRLLGPEDPEGAVAACEEQTEGRGRLGRSWDAPSRSSVLVSVALRPDVPAARLPKLSVVAGEACAEAIAAVAKVEPTVEPPNDVLLGGRKVAGILAEASEGRVTLGIGINVAQARDELPADARKPPTSLRLETDRPIDRIELLVTLLEVLERRYDAWVSEARRRSRPAPA